MLQSFNLTSTCLFDVSPIIHVLLLSGDIIVSSVERVCSHSPLLSIKWLICKHQSGTILIFPPPPSSLPAHSVYFRVKQTLTQDQSVGYEDRYSQDTLVGLLDILRHCQ